MTKRERIEHLEQEVATLKARVTELETRQTGWWSIEPYPKPPYISFTDTTDMVVHLP